RAPGGRIVTCGEAEDEEAEVEARGERGARAHRAARSTEARARSTPRCGRISRPLTVRYRAPHEGSISSVLGPDGFARAWRRELRVRDHPRAEPVHRRRARLR